MFLSLRQRLGEIDLPKWSAIFLFEFVVVLLGVLAAQMLQERFEANRAKASFEDERTALNRQLDNVGSSMILRGLQSRCVTSNLEEIVAAIEEGRAFKDGVFLSHPPMGAAELTVWDGEFATSARRYLDEEEVAGYQFLGLVATDMKSLGESEKAHWATLGLASRNPARMSEARKIEILLAAHKLLLTHEGWDRAPATVVALMQKVGAVPQFDEMERVNDSNTPCAQEASVALAELRKIVAQGKPQ